MATAAFEHVCCVACATCTRFRSHPPAPAQAPALLIICEPPLARSLGCTIGDLKSRSRLILLSTNLALSLVRWLFAQIQSASPRRPAVFSPPAPTLHSCPTIHSILASYRNRTQHDHDHHRYGLRDCGAIRRAALRRDLCLDVQLRVARARERDDACAARGRTAARDGGDA